MRKRFQRIHIHKHLEDKGAHLNVLIVALLSNAVHPASLDEHEHEVVQTARKPACIERAVTKQMPGIKAVRKRQHNNNHHKVMDPVNHGKRPVEQHVVKMKSIDCDTATSVGRAKRRHCRILIGGDHILLGVRFWKQKETLKWITVT